ncbi:MAG: glycosyltransferase [Candidatus Omnitrophota bacterium]|nr:glycosyltransferase [Candidatus Omnitrophota bacterium]
MKKVSVIIPAYNKAELTVKTVESVLAQTYKNTEIIVVDDGSTDDTKQKLNSYHDRIKYVYKNNGGACSARNVGIKKAKGDYIALIDCDDIYLPEKIEMSAKFLDKNPDIGFVHTPVYFIDENDNICGRYPRFKKVPSGIVTKKLLLKNFVCNSTVVARTECFEKVGMFDETIFTPADWDMWLRLSEFYKAGYINKPMTLYRKSESYIVKHLEQSKRELLIVVEKAFKRNPGLGIKFREKLVSNIHYWQALGYLRAENSEKARNEAIIALKKCRFNAKAFVLLLLINIFGEQLSGILKKSGII